MSEVSMLNRETAFFNVTNSINSSSSASRRRNNAPVDDGKTHQNPMSIEKAVAYIQKNANVSVKEAREMAESIAYWTDEMGFGAQDIIRYQQGKKSDTFAKFASSDLEKYIERAPKWQGEAFRGISIPARQLSSYKVGDVITANNGASSSWTSRLDGAVQYSGSRIHQQGTRQVVLGPFKPKHGVSVNFLSPIDEKEIVMSKKARFRIKQIYKTRTYTYIGVESL